ncbi:Pescadillo [Trichinella pseudospiralis]
MDTFPASADLGRLASFVLMVMTMSGATDALKRSIDKAVKWNQGVRAYYLIEPCRFMFHLPPVGELWSVIGQNGRHQWKQTRQPASAGTLAAIAAVGGGGGGGGDLLK